MSTPFYEDGSVTLYHGDCREILPALAVDGEAMLVTDPPYGIGWSRGTNKARASRSHAGIANDGDTSARDAVLDLWGVRPAILFGSVHVAPPPGLVQTLIWRKPADTGIVGSITGFRRDVEAIYLCGSIPKRTVRWSSVLEASHPKFYGQEHPHAKPVDLMARLIELVPGAVVVDPFVGSGTTLVAAKALGRKAIGIEIESRYCEVAAERCAQEVLDFGEAA